MGGQGVPGSERTGSFLLVLADIRTHTQTYSFSRGECGGEPEPRLSSLFSLLHVLVASLPLGHPLTLYLK